MYINHEFAYTFRKNTGILKKGGKEYARVWRRRDGLGIWSLLEENSLYRMEKQEGPTVQNRKLYSISWDRDFPGGPVAKTPFSECRGPELDPCSHMLKQRV